MEDRNLQVLKNWQQTGTVGQIDWNWHHLQATISFTLLTSAHEIESHIISLIYVTF